MTDLIYKLYRRTDNYSDLTFQLPDGTTVEAHKLILVIASSYFEAMFCGPLADRNHNGTVDIRGVDSDAFRRLLDFIYNSGPMDWDMDNIDYFNLLDAANMYIIPALIDHCNDKLSDFIKSLEDTDELIAYVNKASQITIYDEIARAGIGAMKESLAEIMLTEAWLTLEENVLDDLVDDSELNVTEGKLFTGVVQWCQANTMSEEEAIEKFQSKYSEKIIVANISKEELLSEFEPLERFIPDDLFQKWTLEIMRNNCQIGTRYSLAPIKVKQKTLFPSDFLDIRDSRGNVDITGMDPDLDLWRTNDEYPDVDIEIKIYQKISEGFHVPRGKFGILLETTHSAKEGWNRDVVTERVSVKMVAKTEDGTILKKLFKPIEDSTHEGIGGKRNIFVLSKNKDERMQWVSMEVVVIIDRRPECTLKGISGDQFAVCVSGAANDSYLESATSFKFDGKTSMKECLVKMAEQLNIQEKDLNQWLYIFTKGFVSNLRSRRALPNDYWTASTVEDFQRCKVINFPIGVVNEDRRREAFKTWIVSKKMSDEKQKDRKNLFVVTYNPETKERKFVKNITVQVDTRVETLAHSEHINLGIVRITEQFFTDVLAETNVAPGARIFIRRVFPIQDEEHPAMGNLHVTEVRLGAFLTHIDDCHVLVVQDHQKGQNYDDFILSKIRELEITFEPKDDKNGTVISLKLDPKTPYDEILRDLGATLGTEPDNLELFKCYQDKNMPKSPHPRPVESTLTPTTDVLKLVEWCMNSPMIIYYRLKSSKK